LVLKGGGFCKTIILLNSNIPYTTNFLEEKMKKLFTLCSLVVVIALALSACGGGGGAQADNLLDDIKNRGYILVSTDPNYEPQSFLNTDGKRPSDTKCPSDALTIAEMQGFDVDVAKAIGDGLGVETCFATPNWDAITAGNWADKWDVSVGSMTITTERQKILDFSVPYYYTPAVVAVPADVSYTSLDDLAGMALCAGVSTTYETWLNKGDMGLPASSIYAQPPADITVVPLETDQECAQAIAAGREDFQGYVTSQTVVNANIAAGLPVKQLGTPVYSEDLAAAFDKSSTLPTDSLRAEVDKIITQMHTDGTLTSLSTHWFSEDLTMDPTQ
jgi:polar amino acid transport system substrate-binding protein